MPGAAVTMGARVRQPREPSPLAWPPRTSPPPGSRDIGRRSPRWQNGLRTRQSAFFPDLVGGDTIPGYPEQAHEQARPIETEGQPGGDEEAGAQSDVQRIFGDRFVGHRRYSAFESTIFMASSQNYGRLGDRPFSSRRPRPRSPDGGSDGD